MPEESAQEPNQEPVDTATTAKKVRKERKLTDEELEKAISPRPSLWPFALAFAIIIMFMGLIIHPIVLGLGVLLVIVAIIGWALERRT